MIAPVPEVAALTPYATPPLAASVDLRLDITERPIPLAGVGESGTYPKAAALEAALAERFGVVKERVLVTAGADEALDRVCRAYLASSRTAVVTAPTFEMIPHYAKLAGAQLRTVPWYDGTLTLASLLEATQGIRGVCAVVSPNNPTGLTVETETLIALAEQRPDVLLIVDLAYGEYPEVDPTTTLLTRDNVVVTRTFSKAWGMPGARVGYALSSPQVIAAMRVAGGPYAVARSSLSLAFERLRSGEPEMRSYVARARDQVTRLTTLLTRNGVSVPASQASFVLMVGPKVPLLAAALAKRGIGTRAFPNDPHLAESRRIVVPGDEGVFNRLETALTEAFAEIA